MIIPRGSQDGRVIIEEIWICAKKKTILRVSIFPLAGRINAGVFPLVPDSLTEMLALTGNDLPAEAYQEFEFIPVGLEPFLEQTP